MRISDWSSDVCSSDLAGTRAPALPDCPLATGGRKPDMHVVIFEVRPKPGRKGDYLDIAAALRPELEQIDGFISIERFASLTRSEARRGGKGWARTCRSRWSTSP